MAPVEPWDDPYGLVQVEDHCDLAQILHHAESGWMLTAGDHPVIRKSYRRFRRTVLRSATSCQKVIKGKRPSQQNLPTHNYEPPKHSLYTAVAGQMPLLDLFSLARG